MQAEVDTHALMALAGASSFVLGFPFEGALLFCLFHMAHVLEGRFVDQANSNLSNLVDSLPKTIRSIQTKASGEVEWGSQKMVAVRDVPAGALVVVKPGELVPLDGVIFSGNALVGVPFTDTPAASLEIMSPCRLTSSDNFAILWVLPHLIPSSIGGMVQVTRASPVRACLLSNGLEHPCSQVAMFMTARW